MKSVLGALVLSLTVAGVGYAQSDPFHGVWKADESKSKRPPDRQVKQEVITLNIANNVEHCINDNTYPDGRRSRSEYKATYNDGKWYPTTNLDTGKQGGGSVMMLRLEPRKELRLSKGTDGKVGNFIVRMVQPDGKTMKIFTVNPDTGERILDLTLFKQ
jgi:hypothetical protein